MRTVLLAVVWILALNLLAALVLALAEVHARRKIRREIDALEHLWHLEQRAARAQQGTRFAGRTLVAATAMLVLSGVAWASPGARELVAETVSVVVDLAEQPSGDKANEGSGAASPSIDGSSSSARDVPPVVTPRPEREPGQRTAGEVAGEAAPPIESPSGTAPPPSATTPPTASPSPAVDDPVSQLPAVVPFEATATVLSASSIEVGWTAVPTATGFLVERSVDGVTWSSIAQVGPETWSFVNSSLLPSTLYQYRVHATMPSGAEQVADVEATTSPAPLAGPLEVPPVAGSEQSAA